MNNLKMFMPEVSDKERILILEQNADKIETSTYQKNLTEDEKLQRKEILYNNSLKLSDLAEEKKEAIAGFKEVMDPLVADNKTLLSELRTGQVQVTGKIYLMANHETGIMETWDNNGEFVSSRRLFPSEKQLRMPLSAVK